MKVFGVLAALSIILSAAALPSGGTNNRAERTRSGVHLVSPGQPAVGDASSGAANGIVPTCPTKADLKEIFGQLSLLELDAHNKDLRDEINTNIDKFLLGIEGCMEELDKFQVSAQDKQPFRDYYADAARQLEDLKQRVQAV